LEYYSFIRAHLTVGHCNTFFSELLLCSVWIAGGFWGNRPNCFLDSPNTLSKYVLGVSYILYTYNFYHNFSQAPTVEKFDPPANFQQFKHCCYASANSTSL